jgi:hypothetical protein
MIIHKEKVTKIYEIFQIILLYFGYLLKLTIEICQLLLISDFRQFETPQSNLHVENIHL